MARCLVARGCMQLTPLRETSHLSSFAIERGFETPSFALARIQ